MTKHWKLPKISSPAFHLHHHCHTIRKNHLQSFAVLTKKISIFTITKYWRDIAYLCITENQNLLKLYFNANVATNSWISFALKLSQNITNYSQINPNYSGMPKKIYKRRINTIWVIIWNPCLSQLTIYGFFFFFKIFDYLAENFNILTQFSSKLINKE